MAQTPDRKIAWVDNDFAVIAPALHSLEREGFKYTAYETYAEAWRNRAEIGNSSLLLLEAVIPPGRQSPPEIQALPKKHLGLKLLSELRKEGFKLPAVFWTDMPYVLEESLEELRSLNATFVSKFDRPSVLRREIYERLGLPL